METIQCGKCGAVFEKTGAKDKLRRFKDKRFMTTFHCPNCDARVILKKGEEPDTIYLKRLERLKEQARRLGDTQEANELQDEINQISKEMKMDAGKTKDKKFSVKGKDAGYDPAMPKNIAKAKALSVAQGKAASDEAYDPLDPENILKEKELAKARGAAASDAKSAIITVGDNNWDIIIMDSTHIKMSLRYSDGKQNFGIPLHINQLSPDFINALKAKGLIKGNYFVEDSKTKDSLFKGQKVTAIKSEQGLREGETYTVLGEETIIKQVVGEGNTIVYKLQDSSGNVIVIESPEGLFYEVKDSKTKDKYELVWQNSKFEIYEDENNEFELVRKSNKAIIGQYATIQGAKLDAQNSWQDDWKSGKLDNGTKDPEDENESLKVKIGDIRKNMDAARKMGYDTEPYQKEIDKLETKDDNSKNGYYAAMTGKARTDNPFPKGTPENQKWDSDWKIGSEDFKYESNKELFKPKDSDDKELKEMLVNDAPDYYGAIVATARRGNNPQMGSKEVRKNLEPFMAAHGVQFNEEEFNKAYKEFSGANVSKAAFMKGTDSDDVYTKDPLTKKGEKILAAMKKVYGEEKGEQIFYASKNKGTISGVDSSAPQEFNELKAWQNKAMELNYRLENNQQRGLWAAYRGNTEVGTFVPTRGGRLYVDSKVKDAPSPKETYNKIRGFDVTALQGFARRTGYPELNSLKRMDKEGIIEEIISYLHGAEGDRFLENPNNFRDSKTKDGERPPDEAIKKYAPQAPSYLRKHPMWSPVDYAYFRYKGTPDEQIKAYWDRDVRSGKRPVTWGDSETKDQKIDKKFIASCPACQEMRAAGLSYEETHSSHTPGMILVEVNGREKEIPNPHITKDQEIKIIIGDDPVNPSPAEQKVEGNDVIYKEYTLKQLPETGEFEIYAPGGSIVGHAKALELAKLFVDRIVVSRVGDE